MAALGNLTSTAKSIGNSIIGNVDTAYLEIHDYRKAAEEAAAAGRAAAQDFLSVAGQSLGSSLTAKAKSVLGAQASKLGNAVRSQAMQGAQPEKKMFKVQFNPSEIQLYSVCMPDHESNALNRPTQSSSNATEKPRMEMTLRLYFDDMNISDSFMWDKFTSGASAQTITNIATAVAKLKGKTWSVQPQVEGLVAALRNEYTRNVTFHWADFHFTGQVTAIMAQYTMFSTSGRPVRAQVVLRLRHSMAEKDLSGWYSDFNKAFGNEANLLSKASQKIGGLLNIG